MEFVQGEFQFRIPRNEFQQYRQRFLTDQLPTWRPQQIHCTAVEDTGFVPEGPTMIIRVRYQWVEQTDEKGNAVQK